MRTSRLVGFLAALGLCGALVLSACSRAAPGPTAQPTSPTKATSVPTSSSAAPAPAGPYGDLRLGLNSFDAETFDPIKGTSSLGGLLDSPMVDSLLRLDGKKVVAGVADSWEMASDGLSWVFRIHKGIKFHNGDDLTGRDVKFTFERYMSKDAQAALIRNTVDRVDMVDDYTVRVYTKGPQPLLPLSVAWYYPAQGWVQPKNYIEKNGMEYFNAHPIGSGPFKFVSRVPGDSIKYEALDKHWRQAPAFKNLTTVLVPEETTAIAMLKVGQLDIIGVSQDGGQQIAQSGLRTNVLSSQQAVILLKGAYEPDVAGTPLADMKVRQALSLAINRDEIIKTLFYSQATPGLPGFMTEDTVGIDLNYWREQAKNAYNKYDAQRATQLLKEAGYPDRFASSKNIKFYSFPMPGAPFLPKLAEIVASYWQKVGVSVDLIPTDLPSVAPTFNTIRFPNLRGTVIVMKVSGRPDPTQLFQTYVTYNSTMAMLGKAFPEVEQMVAAAASETDTNKRSKMLADVLKISSDAYVGLMIAGVPALVGLGPGVDFPAATGVPELTIYAELVKHRRS